MAHKAFFSEYAVEYAHVQGVPSPKNHGLPLYQSESLRLSGSNFFFFQVGRQNTEAFYTRFPCVGMVVFIRAAYCHLQ